MHILKFNNSAVVVNHIKMIEKTAKDFGDIKKYGFFIYLDSALQSSCWFLTEKERDEEYENAINALAEQ